MSQGPPPVVGIFGVLPPLAPPAPVPPVVPVPAPADPVGLAPPLVGGIEVAWGDRRGAAVLRAAHGFKAWASVRGRLRPESVVAARAAGERWALSYDEYVGVLRQIGEIARLRRRVEDVEDAIEYLFDLVRDLALLPPMLPTSPRRQPRMRPGLGWSPFVGYEEETREQLPPELLAALMAILGRLTAEFLEQLQGVGVEMSSALAPRPARVPLRTPGAPEWGAGPPGLWERGAQVSDFGDTVVLTASVLAGGSAIVTGPTLPGPSVIERILFSQAAGVTGTLEVRAAGGGLTSASGVGDALIQGATGPVITVQGVAFFGDWWPRRLVRRNGFQVFMRYTNTGAAANDVMVAVDRRDVLWPERLERPFVGRR